MSRSSVMTRAQKNDFISTAPLSPGNVNWYRFVEIWYFGTSFNHNVSVDKITTKRDDVSVRSGGWIEYAEVVCFLFLEK